VLSAEVRAPIYQVDERLGKVNTTKPGKKYMTPGKVGTVKMDGAPVLHNSLSSGKETINVADSGESAMKAGKMSPEAESTDA